MVTSTGSVRATGDGEPAVPHGVMARVVARSAWLQASMNFRGMQNLGRLFCLVPVARWLGLKREAWPDFIRRHLSPFNGNPFVATLGIGALARLEVDNATGVRPLRAGVVERFSEAVSGPLGAVGDELFWCAIRPQAALLGVLTAVYAGAWGAFVYVATFGLWQAYYRWKSFVWGWEAGSGVAAVLRGPRFRVPARRAGIAAAVTGGAVGTTLFLQQMHQYASGRVHWLPAGVFALSAVCGALWTTGRRAATWALIGGAAIGIAAGAMERLFVR